MRAPAPTPSTLYFLGICGTAMGNAALLARAAGHTVLGSDLGVYPPMSDVLAAAGIRVEQGYDAARLERLAPDLVVIGNAMSRGNPEVEWLLDTRAIPFVSLPQFLHDAVLARRRNVVVCGTHGKTTTTALAAYLLRAAGRYPGFLIGGVPQDPPVGQHLGAASDPFVIEGDEYDSAFFDKRSKFIHYAPHVAVLNNLEFDHADIFRDLADVQRTFSHLTRIVPRRGWIVLNGDDANLRALGPLAWTRVVRVGTGEANDVRLTGFRESPAGAEFALSWRGRPWAQVSWDLPGEFNARNAAMAATAASLALAADGAEGAGAPSDVARALDAVTPLDVTALALFRGVRRRQEIRAAAAGVTVIEDFGHHPTAIAETLRSLRARHPGARLVAAFEPRSNTARTRALQDGFMRALALADDVYLGAVNRADKLAPEERFDVETVAKFVENAGGRAWAFADHDALRVRLESDTLSVAARTTPIDAASAEARPRVVVFFTNGDFGGIIRRYAEAVLAAGVRLA